MKKYFFVLKKGEDGKPVIDENKIYFALMPHWRRRRVGTHLLREILDEARRNDKRVTIHVETFNPAQSLYARLGFRPVGEAGVHRLLEWRHTAESTVEPAPETRTC